MSRLLTGTLSTPPCRPDRGWIALWLFLLAALPACAASNGSRDEAFGKYPLDKWAAENRQGNFHWRVEIPPPELSTHQRLMLRVVTHVDGREIGKLRDGAGTGLVALLQIKDAAGQLWQNHATVDLNKYPPSLDLSELTITHYAFVLPGDYSVTVAVCEAATLQHNVAVRKLHVAPLKTDPLPGAWDGLPAVEFINPSEAPPDVWYLPDIGERLHVAVQPRRPVHIQILVNTTPSERASASASTMRRNMSLVIPALKIFSQLEIPGSTMDAALLDLTHRRVPFEQHDIGLLDWAKLRNYFLDLQPGLIDVATLRGQWKMRGFFLDEVTRRLQPSDGPLPVVVVISGPAFFDDQKPGEVAPLEALQASGGQLFYIRCRGPSYRGQRPRVRPGMRPPPPAALVDALPTDELEHTLEPLGARIFDAASPEQFRRVLAAVLAQISKL